MKIKSNDLVIEFKYLDNKNQFDFESFFDNVGFSSLFPKPKNILYEGLVNGKISLKKDGDLYNSESSLIINDFSSNGYLLGDALIDINNSISRDKYDLAVKIVNKENNIFIVDGSFQIKDDDFPVNLNVISKNFKIKPFSAIVEDVLQSFEG